VQMREKHPRVERDPSLVKPRLQVGPERSHPGPSVKDDRRPSVGLEQHA